VVPDYFDHYGFHVRARYGETYFGARETFWSTYVSVGIDPASTRVEVVATTKVAGGQRQATLRVTPKDRYGIFSGLDAPISSPCPGPSATSRACR